MKNDFTLVVGIDAKHCDQLLLAWPTWRRHRPELLDRPMLVFYDRDQVNPVRLPRQLGHPHLTLHEWPPANVRYEGDPTTKWYDPQRYRMLAGFVHVPAVAVYTPWWLKIDTDTLAVKNDGMWPESDWLGDWTAIVSQPWGYTKPPDQMELLDRWVAQNTGVLSDLEGNPPLGLRPSPDSDKLRHKRIISWSAFFRTKFTQQCSEWAAATCGIGKLPVPSQDGYLWYCAARLGLPIRRVNMRQYGWCHHSGTKSMMRRLCLGEQNA